MLTLNTQIYSSAISADSDDDDFEPSEKEKEEKKRRKRRKVKPNVVRPGPPNPSEWKADFNVPGHVLEDEFVWISAKIESQLHETSKRHYPILPARRIKHRKEIAKLVELGIYDDEVDASSENVLCMLFDVETKTVESEDKIVGGYSIVAVSKEGQNSLKLERFNKMPGRKKWDSDFLAKIRGRRDVIQTKFKKSKKEADEWLKVCLNNAGLIPSDAETVDGDSDEEEGRRKQEEENELRQKQNLLAAQAPLIPEDLKPGDKISFDDPRKVRGKGSKETAIINEISGQLSESNLTPLVLDNRFGSQITGDTFIERVATWSEKEGRHIKNKSPIRRELKSFDITPGRAPFRTEMQGDAEAKATLDAAKEKMDAAYKEAFACDDNESCSSVNVKDDRHSSNIKEFLSSSSTSKNSTSSVTCDDGNIADDEIDDDPDETAKRRSRCMKTSCVAASRGDQADSAKAGKKKRREEIEKK